MPKETRNPKSDWRRVRNDSERQDSAFWTWGDDDVANSAILREEPPGKGTPPRNLMERVAQFGERIIRFAKKFRGASIILRTID